MGYLVKEGTLPYKAVFWDSDRTVNIIDSYPREVHSFAYAINDQEQVVGTMTLPSIGARAFISKRDSGKQNLNDLVHPKSRGWILREAWAINNAGQIAGFGRYNGGREHAYLATPVYK